MKEKNLNSICDTMNCMDGKNLNWDAISEDILNSFPSLVPDVPAAMFDDAIHTQAIGYDEEGRRIELRELDTHFVSYSNENSLSGKMKMR